jgi:NADH-quinone oxidoreductase subunit M
MILSILTFLPLAAGVLVALLGPDRQKLGRNLAFAASLLALALAVGSGRPSTTRAAECNLSSVPWVPSLGIDYHLGVDGLGLLMVLLSALIVPFAMLASWKIENNPKLYFALVLFLEAGLFGTFTAQNFIHWFIIGN